MNPSPGLPLGNPEPGVPVSGNSPVVKEPQENIPKDTVSVKEGSKVYSSDGKHIGNVERMFVDSDSGRLTNLVIDKGVLLKNHKQIPVDWIDVITEDEVRLAMDAAFISRLPDYQDR
jgi:sporulation protein YlmC with PRC-barrel domain